MKLVKPNLPEEALEYKDRHVWPLKARHDKLAREGNFDQVEARRVLIPALARYVRFLAGCEPTPELEREAEWAAGELATLRRMEAAGTMRVPVIEGGRRPDGEEK